MSILNPRPITTASGDVRYVTKGSLAVNARDFGVVADGIADDTASLQSALAHLAGNPGRTLTFPHGGTVRITAPLGTYNLSNTTIDLGNAIIDASGVTGSTDDVLKVGGSLGTSTNLTADLADKSKTLTIGSTTGYAAGDMVFITSGTVFDPARTGAKYGELNYVESIDSGTQITLKMEANAAYTTAATATVRRVSPVKNFTLTGGTIRSTATSNTLRGVYIEYGHNVRVEAVNFQGINRVQLQLGTVAESTVTLCRFAVAAHASQAYGCSVLDACQDIIISNNVFSEVRHALSTNNTIAHGGIVRRILFTGNNVTDSAPATGGTGGDAIDTHAGSEEIYIINNVVNSSSSIGINSEARSAAIIGNQISNTAAHGIQCIPYSTLAGRFTVQGNRLRNVAGSYGINFSATQADVTSATITGNVTEGTASSIRAIGTSPYFIRRLTLVGNTAESITGTSVSVTRAPGAVVSGNHVRSGATIGLQVDTCDNASVTGNTSEVYGTSGASGHCIRVQGTAAYSSVSGNTARYSATGITNMRGMSFASTITYSGMWTNTAQGCTTPYELSTGTGNAQANNI